jgi:TfoX-like protein
MAYNEKLADRVRELIALTEDMVEEKRIFSGLCFMVNDKMCVAIKMDSIMIRFDPAISDRIMEMDGIRPMIHSGRIMKGFAFVSDEVLTTRKQLEYWVGLALDYNKIARSSKEKKPSVRPKAAGAKKPPISSNRSAH